jgi:hypothetical protein
MDNLLEPYDRLVRIVILGRVFEVPANNILLRQMQYVSPDIGSGRYCWNAECRYCEIEYRRTKDASDLPALACRLKGLEGMVITKAAAEIRYNLSDALAAAKTVESAETKE